MYQGLLIDQETLRLIALFTNLGSRGILLHASKSSASNSLEASTTPQGGGVQALHCGSTLYRKKERKMLLTMY